MAYVAHVALVVRDYDEALTFYVGKLGFSLIEDTYIADQDKRWVVVAPPGTPQGGATILLARASDADQARFIGDQAGGRIFLFLATNDFERDFRAFTVAGVRFVRPPTKHSYGTVAVFEDLYGNLWDLIEYQAPAKPRPVERTPATRSPQEWVEWMTERQKSLPLMPMTSVELLRSMYEDEPG